MATLTYDPTEYQESEFSQEELDSLAVGEQLQQEQEQLLAGKYRDAEELEQAYIELQKKLGNRQTEQPEVEPEAEVLQHQEEQQQVDADFLEQLWEEAQTDYTEETLNKLQNMDPADLAQMYLDYRAQTEQELPELTPGDVEQLYGVVGGQAEYDNMIAWAGQTLSPQEINMYDSVMDRGDPLSCFFAVQALAYRFQDAQGYDGQMLTGRAPSAQQEGFRSQAELVRAMSDPRYDNDPAYRADVAAKLEMSDLSF